MGGALFLVPAAGSLAAPDNKNTFTIEVSCETHGDIPVTISGRSSADVGFTEDGPAVVKKGLSPRRAGRAKEEPMREFVLPTGIRRIVTNDT